jgi:hypothetical protein
VHRLGNDRAGQQRGEQFDEVVSVAAQVFVLADRDARGVGLEQVLGIDHAQVPVAFRDEGDLGEDADAQPEFHIGFDHVGVDRGERDIRCYVRLLERLVDLAASAEGEVVGDDGVLRDLRQGQPLFFQQRVFGRHDYAVVPFVARQRDEVVIQRQAFGRDRDIGLAVQYLFGDLRWIALVQAEFYFRVTPDELFDHRRQDVARLGVGGGDGQVAAVLRVEFLPDLPEVFRVVQHAPGDVEDGLAGLGDGDDALAVAHENIDAQLLLQLFDLFADVGLRGVQRVGGIGNLQAAPHDLIDITQLLQVHGGAPI